MNRSAYDRPRFRCVRAGPTAQPLRDVLEAVIARGEDPADHPARLASLGASEEGMPPDVFTGLLQVVALQEELNYPSPGVLGRRKPLQYLDALPAGTPPSRVIAASPVGARPVRGPIWTHGYR